MRTIITLLITFTMTALISVANPISAWQPVGDKILSKFAGDVSPDSVHQEYPRPQMVRSAWQNLNGLWDYAIVAKDQTDFESQGKILVPFAVESALSGVGKTVNKDQMLIYNRSFTIPKAWNGKKVLLHFGAVDWDATVIVNGVNVGQHKGGYTPFTCDITDAIEKNNTEQFLEVRVLDPTSDGYQPRGKQINNPHGIWYTPVTGIWQTVWLEAVPQSYIESFQMTPSLANETLTLKVKVANSQPGDRILAAVPNSAISGGADVENGEATLVLKVKKPRAWTPNSPYLYSLAVSLSSNRKNVDNVTSYFGMRDITLAKDDKGQNRILLNGKFLFQHGPLDQGWWPDGLYTAPTDEALKYDIEITKKMGFNMLRKHVKVEPARFYYWCDKLGILVWQDMPSGGEDGSYIRPHAPDFVRTEESAANFYAELTELINSFYNYPSIVIWVPFNEGWGQFDTEKVVDYCRQLDQSRLIINTSGWTDRPGIGDINDMHSYPGPGMPKLEENRAVVLGEYGGLGLPMEGHTWVDKGNWGYVSYQNMDDLFVAYDKLNKALHPLIAQGLCAAVYTQTTDVEVEVNGLMTYDRKVLKFDPRKIKPSNDKLHRAAPEAVSAIPISEGEWQYTTTEPGEGWQQPDFDTSAWQTGKPGFGLKEISGLPFGTEWNTDKIWLKRTFELTAEDVAQAERFVIKAFHDGHGEVFINGVRACGLPGHYTGYTQTPLSVDAAKALKAGQNVITVVVNKNPNDRYIDLGLLKIAPLAPNAPVKW